MCDPLNWKVLIVAYFLTNAILTLATYPEWLKQRAVSTHTRPQLVLVMTSLTAILFALPALTIVMIYKAFIGLFDGMFDGP